MYTPSTIVRALLILVLSIVPAGLTAQHQHGTHPSEHGGEGHGHHHDRPPVQSKRSFGSTQSFFTENRGQFLDVRGMQAPDVLYRAASGGADVLFTRKAIVYQFGYYEGDRRYFSDRCGDGRLRGHDGAKGDSVTPPVMHLERIDMELVGANPHVRVEASNPIEEHRNYYLAHCPDGILGVRSYQHLIYRDVYPNIDMIVNATPTGAKCDFVVRPGGRVADIQMRFVGAANTSIDKEGGLRMNGRYGYVAQEKPYTYTAAGIDGRQQLGVRSKYVLSNGMLGFEVGSYDRSKTLVIDPKQLWATFYGGTSTEQLSGGDPSEVDRKGNVIITGSTGMNFPIYTQPGTYTQTLAGVSDAFVAKFSGDGRKLWATIIGGSYSELAHGVASDADCNVLIAGHTFSHNFPTTAGVVQPANGRPGTPPGDSQDSWRDAFAVKFDTNGIRLWATYYGGQGFDDGYGFAIDSSHNVALLITTGVNGLQTTGPGLSGMNDAMIVKLDGNGQRLWSRYFGGSRDDYGYAAATDINNNIIITGYTYSDAVSFPMTNAIQPANGGSADAFVIKLDAGGNMRWSTFYGGSGRENDDAAAIAYCGLATDLDGNIFLGGLTTGGTFPTRGGVFQAGYRGGNTDGYIVKFDSNGAVPWATFVGGSLADVGVGVASNARGSVLLTGFTASNVPGSYTLPGTFPLTPAIPADRAPIQATHAGGPGGNAYDAFIVKLDKNGTQQWGTYLGDNGNDQGEGISFDIYGSIIIAGQTTSGAGARLAYADPITGNAIIQSTNGGGTDAFVSVICDPDLAPVDSSGPHTVCYGDTLRLWVLKGYTSVKWFRKDPAPGNAVNELMASRGKDTISVSESGRFFAMVTNVGGCEASTDTINVTKLPRINPSISPASPALLCTGDTLTLSAGPGTFTRYAWLRTAIDTVTTQTMKVWRGDTYKLYVWNAFGCKDSAKVYVNEQPKPTAVLATKDTVICEDENAQFSTSGGVGGTITWYKVGSATSVGAGPTYQTNKAGVYYATSTSPVGCVTRSNNVNLKVNLKPKPKLLALLPVVFCEGGDGTALEATAGGPTEALLPGGNYVSYQWSSGQTTRRITIKDADVPFGSTTFTVTVTDTNGCIGEAQLQVTKNPKPRPRIVPGDTTICEGQSVTLSADGSYSTYAWNNGSTDQRITVGRPGTTPYVVTVFTPEGCFGISDTVFVTVIPKPVADISGPLAVCINSTQSYEVPVTAGVTYTWELQGPSGTIASGAGTSKIDVNWGAAGDNKVILTITNSTTGCKALDTIIVKVGSVLQPSITTNRPPRLCPGDTVELDAGAGFSKYTWSNGATSQKIKVWQPGTYTVTVENATGCAGTSLPLEVTITSPKQPVITPNRSLSLCPGDTVQLDAGADYKDYLWSNGASIRAIKVWASGTFSVTTTDSNGCEVTSATVEVVMNTPPVPAINGPNSACINSTVQYDVTVPGGGAGDTYQWKVIGTGGTMQSGQGTNTISVLWGATGNDTVEVTVTSGTTGCVGTIRYAVTVGTTLSPVITTNKPSTSFCPGDSITLIAPAGYSNYAWQPGGETSQTITVKAEGLYQVTVSDAFGCSGSGEITVTVNPPFKPTVNAPKLGFCPGDSVMLEAPVGFVKYLWAPTGDTTSSIWTKTPGAYTVVTTDIDGCTGTSDPVTVVANAAPIIIGINQVGLDLVADVDEVGGPAIASYQWYQNGNPISGANAKNYTTSLAADYSVTCTSVDGCVASFGPVRPATAASSTLELATFTAAPGERVIVPIMMTTSDNLDRNLVEEFEATLRFNKTLLIPGDATPNTVVGPDRLMTIKGKRSANMVTGELLRLEFIAALGNAESTPLSLEAFRWLDTANGPVAVSTVNGLFTLRNICETGGQRLLSSNGATKISVVRPNPTNGITDIEYEVVERGNTQMYVVDVLGNKVATLVDGLITPGSYLVQFDAEGLASGMYYCVLVTPTQRLTHVMHVVR